MVQIEDAHAQICGTAERLFEHIRDSLSAAAVPAAKSALLGPLDQELAFQLSVQLFGTSDASLMKLFTCAPACPMSVLYQEHPEWCWTRSLPPS